MANSEVFRRVDSGLSSVFEELRQREPIFHTAGFGAAIPEFDKAMAPDYWEVGASGRRYSREFILRALDEHPPVDAAFANWQSYDYGLRRLGPDTYLFTYTLCQAGRVTRRATIWQASLEGWRIVYHQGTIVAAEEDDIFPA